MSELVDDLDLKSSGGFPVQVRVLLPVFYWSCVFITWLFILC